MLDFSRFLRALRNRNRVSVIFSVPERTAMINLSGDTAQLARKRSGYPSKANRSKRRIDFVRFEHRFSKQNFLCREIQAILPFFPPLPLEIYIINPSRDPRRTHRTCVDSYPRMFYMVYAPLYFSIFRILIFL